MNADKNISSNGASTKESSKTAKTAAAKTEPGADGAEVQKEEGDTEKPLSKLSVSEIFAIMQDQTVRIKELHGRIASIRAKKAELKARKKEIQKLMKGIGRFEGKLNVISKRSRLSQEDRLLLKAEKEFIKKELITLEEEKFRKMKELKDLVGSNVKSSKKQQTINKAMSKSYIARNRWSIEARLLKAFNDVIGGENKEHLESLKALKNKVKDNMSDDDVVDFNNSLADFLDAVDPEIYVMCSHELKKPLFEAIRLTLGSWDAEKLSQISELVLPAETEISAEEEKPESTKPTN